jgi:hypothetical protein
MLKIQAAIPCGMTARPKRSVFDRVGCQESLKLAHSDQDVAKRTASRDFSALNLSAQADLADSQQLRCVLQLHGERFHFLVFHANVFCLLRQRRYLVLSRSNLGTGAVGIPLSGDEATRR